jgi:hypothetical protein
VALEGAECFAFGLSFADAPVEVGACFGVVLERMTAIAWIAFVDLAVAAAVESLPDGLA